MLLVVACTVTVAAGHGSVPAGADLAQPTEQPARCGSAPPGYAVCLAVQLLNPNQNWHVGPAATAPHAQQGPGTSGALSPPNSGYYPVDLLSAYGLAGAAAHMAPGPSAPTVVVVSAFDDPNAASDLTAYRASLSAAKDPNTGLTNDAIPPLCSTSTTTDCVTFTKLDQSGGTSFPSPDAGWAVETSIDLDMVSAVCPVCNITLVEATTNLFGNFVQAAKEAKSLNPTVVSNSYAVPEGAPESQLDYVYSAGPSTAITAGSGDHGFGTAYPSAAPNVTAVGGTSLTHTGTGTSLVWNPQTVWSGAGSGCTAYESMPAWQADPNVYSLAATCTKRQVADVAAVADPATGVAVYDTYGQTGWLVQGGTSVGTPILAAAYGLAAGNGAFAPSPSALYVDAGGSQIGPTPGLVPVASGSSGSCGNYLCDAAHALPSGYNGPAGLGTLNGISALSGRLSFAPTSTGVAAGVPTPAVTVHLSTPAPSSGVAVTLATSSASGGFSTSPGGPFTPGSTVSVSAGATQSRTFYYRDTAAGSPSVTATAPGWSSAALPVSVAAGPLASIAVSPASARVIEGAKQGFSASGRDQYGNPQSVNPTWSTTAPGATSPTTGITTVFHAGSSRGSGKVTATQGSVSGSASVTVIATTVRLIPGALTKKTGTYRIPLTATVKTGGVPTASASVALRVFSGTACSGTAVLSAREPTGGNGTVTFTFKTVTARTWCGRATATVSGQPPISGRATFST